MKQSTKVSFLKKPLVAVALVAAMTVTAFAAWTYLAPSDVANHFDAPALATAFDSEDALLVNETKSQNGYDISFLGLVSGAGLSGLETAMSSGENGAMTIMDASEQNSSGYNVESDKTYAVVAIAKEDGEMSLDDAFFVSPIIHGIQPWQYNIASMNGMYQSVILDGVLYRLIECDSMEVFADRGLSLVVSSTVFYSTEAFDYDGATGLVSPKPGFDGVNVVFDLPLDPAKGDFYKGQQYLDSLWDDSAAPKESGTAEGSDDLNDSFTIVTE